MPDQLNLDGRIGVVTGSTRGIGAAIAQVLASKGMNLILTGRTSPERLEDSAQAIVQTYDVQVQTYIGDFAEPETAAAVAKLAFSKYRRLDLWVNNAGILVDGLVGMIPAGEIDRTIAVNLSGVLHGIQQAARLMTRCGGGSIVNLASIIGRYGNAGQLVYGASKAGVIGATLSAAKELAPKNIRVNAVAPGFIATDMVAQLPPEKYQERLDSIAMGRIGRPEEVADTVLYLASDLSQYVTGQIIGVDGGMVV